MRYTMIDLQCEDILWFGIDPDGCVAAFTSAGVGNVPEFVCRSKEETEKLLKFFSDELSPFTGGRFLKIYHEDTEMFRDCENLTSKGVYCYDICDHDEQSYQCVAFPDQPVSAETLPEEIRQILKDHLINSRFSQSPVIQVPHAYK